MKYCTICFLDEVLHFNIRKDCQNDEAARHLSHLRNYRNKIISISKKLIPVKDCAIHAEYTAVSEVYDYLNEAIDLSSEIYDTIIQFEYAIENWNNGNTSASISSVGSFIDSLNESTCHNLSEFPPLLFRGRINEKSLNTDDLYHIPFNKRHLVGNQRFSLSGHPFLYLGTSVVNIYNELNVNQENESEFQICSYIPKDAEKLKVFNLTNPYRNLEIIYDLLEDGCVSRYNFPVTPEEEVNDRRQFRKFILSSCCLFKCMHNNSKFSEEYILPQLVTEAIRNKGYSGIKFPSTKLNPSDFSLNFYMRESSLRDNFALFTKYSDSCEYDFELLNSFWISEPEGYKVKSMIIPNSHEKTLHNLKILSSNHRKSLSYLYANLSAGHYTRGNSIDMKYWESACGEFELHLANKAVAEMIAHYDRSK